jgi:hypothetical protein
MTDRGKGKEKQLEPKGNPKLGPKSYSLRAAVGILRRSSGGKNRGPSQQGLEDP